VNYTTNGDQLSERLRRLAVLLNGTELPHPVALHVIIHTDTLGVGRTALDDTRREAVTALAAALNLSEPRHEDGADEYTHFRASSDDGADPTVTAQAFVRRPVTELEQLRARVAELEAERDERDAEPEVGGAAYAIDRDGDRWDRFGPAHWTCNRAVLGTDLLIAEVGPIRWFDADNNEMTDGGGPR
jgi:hypothetical protein